MVGGRAGRKQRISEAFEEFHGAMAAALGAADGLQDAAVRAHAETIVETWLRTEGLDDARDDPALAVPLANPQLADVVARVEADRAAAFDPWLRTGPAALTELMERAAPFAAGLDPDRWLGEVGKADGIDEVPGLWRIGTGRIGSASRPPGKSLHRPVTWPVGVPLLDESHLQITSTGDGRAHAESLVESLLMRLVSHFTPGLVRLHVWDVGQFTGVVPGLYPLTRSGLLTVHDPGRLSHLLEELSDRIRRVHTRLLIDGHPTLAAHVAATGTRVKPWIVTVLVGDGRPLADEDHWQVQRISRGGLASGVTLVLVDVPVTIQAPHETVRLHDGGAATTSMTGEHVVVRLDPPLGRGAVKHAADVIADAHEHGHARAFADLLPAPGRWGREKSITGLRAPIGFADGMPHDAVLADESPHALIGGPSGTGKTNLLLTMISSMAARYGPDELEFYLLDFKEGVSFAQFTRGRRDTTWLPHARLVGVNINTDREFGLALLQFLSDEMRRRSEAAKDHEVTKLEELRGADPDGRWPRIVAVIDEFQLLFSERDDVTKKATALLEDVARRGRSQGIHLVLASQDVSGIEAFWGRPAVFEQFVLRIALPRARRVLGELNEAAMDLPRWHAVVNHDSGVRHGNEVVRIPDATARGTTDVVQRELHERYHEGRSEPVLFDGSRAPGVTDLIGLMGTGGPPRALLGQCIDVGGRPATAVLADTPGRNVAVLGADAEDAVRVLGAAAGSLAGQYPPGSVDLVVVPLLASADALVARFAAAGHTAEIVALDGVRSRIEALAADVVARLAGGPRRPVLLVLYGADAADPVLEREGTDALRRVLRSGPETGVHVLGWWRSVARLRALLSISAATDDVGAWVGLDVQGSELGLLAPGMMLSWSPRPGRGLFYDRAQHSRPEVVIVPSLEEP
ncbi:FtsK/SpoIIIE domain-containing protein [Pseudonocardia abyssalis]|uniref:Cell division protein FtsK n=1 Tax=Pseudonocardia abyssalis TaxID=2792008 RepID=A0ABS6UVE8_9PSEU|nr:FtsK/SpoIIIE domain-containing protein [Pseudonocardia abyssalis]MBW0119238.1 cell division protein FtsK [Pseudonocardia abyssalis]MBW0135941.1 cell division protein FtsK [Pseudonocardia abyssalis]